jgi:hypothetical protein
VLPLSSTVGPTKDRFQDFEIKSGEGNALHLHSAMNARRRPFKKTSKLQSHRCVRGLQQRKFQLDHLFADNRTAKKKMGPVCVGRTAGLSPASREIDRMIAHAPGAVRQHGGPVQTLFAREVMWLKTSQLAMEEQNELESSTLACLVRRGMLTDCGSFS